MTDEPTPTGEPGSALSTITDAVEGYVTGLPAPIRKGAIKAFGQLLSAAIKYPLAILQGAAEERRAETKARLKIIEAQANRIAEKTNVSPEYIEAASTKFAHKIVREQINLDKIVDISAEQLQSEDLRDDVEVPPVDSDWLNAFEALARNMSSDQMQALFGKILAGEISKPSSFSIRTINVIAQLDNKTANKFQLLVSMLTTIKVPNSDQILDTRVVGFGNASQNTLSEFGLSFVDLNVLQENGLIISDFASNMDYGHAIAINNTINVPLTFRNNNYALVPKSAEIKERPIFQVSGVGLTKVGIEMAKVVEIVDVKAYEHRLSKFYDDSGYIFTKM